MIQENLKIPVERREFKREEFLETYHQRNLDMIWNDETRRCNLSRLPLVHIQYKK